MWTEKDLSHIESVGREGYEGCDREWLLKELLLRNMQLASAVRRERESHQRQIEEIRHKVGVAGHFWNVCIEARRRYPNPRKTINIDEAVAEAESRYGDGL